MCIHLPLFWGFGELISNRMAEPAACRRQKNSKRIPNTMWAELLPLHAQSKLGNRQEKLCESQFTHILLGPASSE